MKLRSIGSILFTKERRESEAKALRRLRKADKNREIANTEYDEARKAFNIARGLKP